MIKTSYICDKCGAVQDSPEQFWTIGLVYSHQGATYLQYSTPKKKHTMQLCRRCLVDLGILIPANTDEPVSQSPPTLEELIRDIIREEINE